MNVTDGTTDVQTAGIMYEKVQTAAPLALNDEKTRAILRDNVFPISTRQLETANMPEGITALYERLSKDDNLDGESNSIAMQKKILEHYCKEHGYTAIRHYEDDGFSGTTFERPNFQAMLADIKAGRITRVIVKDMSRFGRDYLQVGMFTEIMFPNFGVHFVAVNDNVDSTRGDNEFAAIRNVFNEMYARDTSKKIRATWQSKGKSGEHLSSQPPYGYKKSPQDKKKWVVDEEAAAVVQKIFSLCMGGMGPTQIANWLREQRILCPSAYHLTYGRKGPKKPPQDPCKWTNEAVSSVLRKLEYLGHTVNFRTTKQSYKSNKLIYNNPDDWAIFENTQEPIIEPGVFWTVQNIRQGRRRPTRTGEVSIFSGLLFCADCGSKLYRQVAYNRKSPYFYTCSRYHADSKNRQCTVHYIGSGPLEEIVLRNLREAIAYVSRHEDEFVRELAEMDMRERDKEQARNRDRLAQAENRIAELDGIIKHLYEDSITGKLTDERFIKLSADYEREQNELKAATDALRRAIGKQNQKKNDVKSFVAATKKYTDLQELDAAVLRELIEKIYISERDKETKTQEVEIVYNFIGAFGFGKATEQSDDEKKPEKADIA